MSDLGDSDYLSDFDDDDLEELLTEPRVKNENYLGKQQSSPPYG